MFIYLFLLVPRLKLHQKSIFGPKRLDEPNAGGATPEMRHCWRCLVSKRQMGLNNCCVHVRVCFVGYTYNYVKRLEINKLTKITRPDIESRFCFSIKHDDN